MVSQTEFTLRPRTRGFHLITDEVVRNLPPLPQTGLLYLFIKHTSAALSINENADPDVRTDTVSYTHLRAHETDSYLVCRLLLEKKKNTKKNKNKKIKTTQTYIYTSKKNSNRQTQDKRE